MYNTHTFRNTYNLNSSPLTIGRYGLMSDGETVGLVDDLTLTYSGNQLIKVEDSADPVILESSLDAQSGTFSYDCDGRIERFGPAGMTKYAPNDMPVYIRSQGHYGLAEFAYTATGEKLMSAICDSRTDSPRERRLYVGQFELFKSQEDTVPKLNRINLPWGYVTSDGKTYLYTTDYQGNIRVVTDSEGNAVQTTDYYPYGLPMATSTGAEENRYKFGGTRSVSEPFERRRENELETAQGLNFHDFEARMLFNDRLLFNRLDDHADDYPFQNPYLYCAANPIAYIDPTGCDTIRVSYVDDKWVISDPIIQEGDDVFLVTKDGKTETYTFSEGEYGKRVCVLNLEIGDTKNDGTLGVYHISGNESEHGYFITPGGDASTVNNSDRRLPDDIYTLKESYRSAEWRSPWVTGTEDVNRRGIKCHYGTSPTSTIGCYIFSKSYEYHNGIPKFNLDESKEAYKSFCSALGECTFENYIVKDKTRIGAIYKSFVKHSFIVKTKFK